MKGAFTVRDLPESDRPRERLTALGPEALSAQELLALILGSGTSGESVMMSAQKLLSAFRSLEGVLNASLEDLQKVKGLGIAKATQMKACFEIARRVHTGGIVNKNRKQNKPVVSPREVYEMVKSKISNYTKEHFIVISFDTRSKFLGLDTVSIGTLNTNLTHPREIFEAAIRRHAAQVILAHNHPSNDPTPSENDLAVTKKLSEAGKLMEIPVLDHIVTSRLDYTSIRSVRPDLF